jgi:hypothetical protein
MINLAGPGSWVLFQSGRRPSTRTLAMPTEYLQYSTCACREWEGMYDSSLGSPCFPAVSALPLCEGFPKRSTALHQ